jgi:rod shape-determining protein MreC
MPNFLYLVFFAFIFVLFYFFEINKDIKVKLLDINHYIQKEYNKKFAYYENIVNQHQNQADTIEKLQKKLLINKMNSIPLDTLKQELQSLKHYNQNFISYKNTYPVRTLYFEKINNYTKIWVALDKKIHSISGLLDGDIVTGIIKLQDNKPIALLNQNPKCNYGVFIGNDKALGITHGMGNSQNILVNFIPLWNDIKEGDEVITNGLDNIFFKGLKVGRVIKVVKQINHFEAIVKPYSSPNAKKYYSIYIKDLNTTN